MIIEIIIEKVEEGCRVGTNPDLLFKGSYTRKSNKEILLGVRRLEKIAGKGASIPDTMPTVLVVQDAGGQIVDCSKRNARTRCLFGRKSEDKVRLNWKNECM